MFLLPLLSWMLKLPSRKKRLKNSREQFGLRCSRLTHRLDQRFRVSATQARTNPRYLLLES